MQKLAPFFGHHVSQKSNLEGRFSQNVIALSGIAFPPPPTQLNWYVPAEEIRSNSTTVVHYGQQLCKLRLLAFPEYFLVDKVTAGKMPQTI